MNKYLLNSRFKEIMELINNNLFKKLENLLQILKENHNLTEIQSNVIQKNSVLFDSNECEINFYFNLILMKCEIKSN